MKARKASKVPAQQAGATREAWLDQTVNDAWLRIGTQRDFDFYIMLPLDKKHESIVEELCDVLGLSLGTTVNTAVKYALFCIDAKILPPGKQRRGKKPAAENALKLALSAETASRLNEVGLLDDAPQYALLGIEMLHDSLIRSRKSHPREAEK